MQSKWVGNRVEHDDTAPLISGRCLVHTAPSLSLARSLTRKLYQLAVLIHFDDSNALVPLRKQRFDVQAGVAVGKQAQIVLNKVVDGTAIALEYDHATVVCLFTDGLRVARVAQLAQVDNLHAALHAAESLQCRRRQGT